jgi:hypothetical protein
MFDVCHGLISEKIVQIIFLLKRRLEMVKTWNRKHDAIKYLQAEELEGSH